MDQAGHVVAGRGVRDAVVKLRDAPVSSLFIPQPHIHPHRWACAALLAGEEWVLSNRRWEHTP